MWKEQALPSIQTDAGVHFLYCVSKYPARLEDIRLKQVDFEKRYSGISDHTIGITAGIVAFSRGAQILEKHFTLNKNMYGPDHRCSMTPDELSALNNFRKEISLCL
jgi:sialic acid synthase SpsE